MSNGLSNEILDNNIQHYCCTEKGSSGPPILLLETFKVIGVNIGAPLNSFNSFEYNIGNYIKSTINAFKNKEEEKLNFKSAINEFKNKEKEKLNSKEFDIKISKLRNNLSNSKTNYENKNFYMNENQFINKKNIYIKFSNLKKLYKRVLFNILVFLDDNDLINIFITNNKFKLLLNMSICDAYFFEIKNQINRYKLDLEVLKYSLIYSTVKERLKIDFSINI